MSKRLAIIVALAAASVSPAAVAATPTAKLKVTTVSATLTGKAVPTKSSPAKGSPTGSGHITIKLDPNAGTACWTITTKQLDKSLSAHVHKGQRGQSGPVTIPLGDVFAKTGCVSLGKAVLLAVAKSPKLYYVDVHTKKYVNGAIRGQLHAGA
jgi:CHRD domain